jgi:hypothetical protein
MSSELIGPVSGTSRPTAESAPQFSGRGYSESADQTRAGPPPRTGLPVCLSFGTISNGGANTQDSSAAGEI